MKIYISGKISGIELKAQELFVLAEYEILALGYIPLNPMNLIHNHNLSWEEYMKIDIRALMECDGIYMLKNWRESIGASVEHDLAEKLNYKIIYQ